jgi:hypothetical protein
MDSCSSLLLADEAIFRESLDWLEELFSVFLLEEDILEIERSALQFHREVEFV